MPAFTRIARYLPGLGILLVVTAGCGGGGGSTTTTTTTTGSTGSGTNSAANSFYIALDNAGFLPPSPSNLLQLPRTGSGTVSPTANVTGPAGVIFGALAVDSTGNVYVAGQTFSGNASTGSEVLVYAPGATGTATPARTISGAALQTLPAQAIAGMDVDAAGNLYVATPVAVGSGAAGILYTGIVVYPPTANGAAAATKTIAGSNTQISSGGQIAVDAANNVYIPVGNTLVADSILMFNASATGNVAPTAVLGGTKTTIYYARGVAVDTTGNLYVASLAYNPDTTGGAFNGTPSILEFSAGSTGNVAPTRVISGTATGLGLFTSLRVDSAGNIYVNNAGTILKFGPTASGNVAPLASITTNVLGSSSGGIAVQ